MINIGKDLSRIDSKFYSIHKSTITILETQKDGEAELELCFPHNENVQYIKLEKENTPWLNFGDNKRCADGIILAIEDMTIATIYIVELKASVAANKWTDILAQFRGALLRAIAFCHTIGLEDITEVNFYTSCENHQRIDDEKHTRELQMNLRGTVGKKRKTGLSLADIDQWGERYIYPFKTGQAFKHQVVRLTKVDGINKGTFTIE